MPITTFHSNQGSVTLEGLVLPAQWDESGDVVGLKIATFDEGEYAIVNDEIGRELIHYLRQKIAAGAHFVDDDTDRKCVKITSYFLLKPE